MKNIFLIIFTLIFFNACDDDDNFMGSSATPVTVVQMELSGVESNFSEDDDAQTTFTNNLANSLGCDAGRITILSVTMSRGSANIELLFSEPSTDIEPSIESLLGTVVDIEEVGDYGVTVELVITDNSQSAEYMLVAANIALENILHEMYSCEDSNQMSGDGIIDGDCDDWDENDFTTAHNLYIEALSHDQTHAGANFGAGLTEMLTITHDPLLIEITEKWDDWDDGGEIFPDNDRSESASFNSGLPLGINAFMLPKNIDFTSYLPFDYLINNFVRRNISDNSHNGRDDTQMSDMMDIIDNVFIARLTNSINYLNMATDQDFVFHISSEMQGNMDQDPLEMDDTEIHLLTAGLHAMRYMFYSISAIDLDTGINDEDDIEDYSIFDQDSEFLTLRNGKEDYFPNAHADITAMLTSLTAAYNFLKNDNDTDNDITLWDEVSGQMAENPDGQEIDIEDFIKPETGGTIYDIFNSNMTITDCDYNCDDVCNGGGYYDEWYMGGQCYCYNSGYNVPVEEECFDMVISLGGFMTNPPNNLKNILPEYTVETLFERELNEQWENGNSHPTLDLSSCNIDCNMNENGWCENSYYTNWYNNGSDLTSTSWTLDWGNLEGCNPIEEYAQELFNNINAMASDYTQTELSDSDHWYCEQYGVFWDGGLSSHIVEDMGNGEYRVDFNVNYGGCWFEDDYEPCIEWDAADFTTWKSQWDITLGGLLPAMSNGPFFNEVISIDEDDWEEDINKGCSEEEGDDF